MTKRLAIFWILLLALLPACSVKYSFTGAAIDANIKTVSVSYFQNRAAIVQAQLSDALTDALKRKLMSETRLIIVPSDGDIQFEGEIVDYTQTNVAPQANETSGLTRLTVGVKFRFINNKTPEKNVEDKISKYRDFDAATSITAVEGNFVTEISKQIVDEMFLKSLAGW